MCRFLTSAASSLPCDGVLGCTEASIQCGIICPFSLPRAGLDRQHGGKGWKKGSVAAGPSSHLKAPTPAGGCCITEWSTKCSGIFFPAPHMSLPQGAGYSDFRCPNPMSSLKQSTVLSSNPSLLTFLLGQGSLTCPVHPIDQRWAQSWSVQAPWVSPL